MNVKFTCPRCQGNIVDELVYTSVWSTILLKKNGDYKRRDPMVNDDDFEIQRYACHHCGYVILDSMGDYRPNGKDLVNEIKELNKESKK